MDIGSFIALLAAVGGLISAVLSVRVSRASVKKDEVDTLRGIIETQAEHIAAQEARIAKLEAENNSLRRRYNRLYDWAREMGLDPNGQITRPLDLGG